MRILVHKTDDGDLEIDVNLDTELAHEICMGLRYGLFGSDASDGASIDGTVEDIMRALGKS